LKYDSNKYGNDIHAFEPISSENKW
jgi:hypothetical protein